MRKISKGYHSVHTCLIPASEQAILWLVVPMTYAARYESITVTFITKADKQNHHVSKENIVGHIHYKHSLHHQNYLYEGHANDGSQRVVTTSLTMHTAKSKHSDMHILVEFITECSRIRRE